MGHQLAFWLAIPRVAPHAADVDIAEFDAPINTGPTASA